MLDAIRDVFGPEHLGPDGGLPDQLPGDILVDSLIPGSTSRGNNVDEDALLAALESGKLRGAGLDVFAEEPAKNHALYSHPHVSCTPHIGAQTAEAQKRVGAEIVDIIKNFA